MSMKSESWPRAALILAEGGTTEAAAEAAGVTARTIQRWRADEPEFADAVADARSRMLDRATGRLAASTSVFAETLATLAADESVRPQYRIAASRSGLEFASRYLADVHFEERLRSLEMAAGLRRKETAA